MEYMNAAKVSILEPAKLYFLKFTNMQFLSAMNLQSHF
jgi:hypothetical protein